MAAAPPRLHCISAWITWCWILPQPIPGLIPLAGTIASALSPYPLAGPQYQYRRRAGLCRRGQDSDRFALFHGSYLSVAHSRVSQKEGANQGRVLEIMRLLRANAPTTEIEAQFKLDSLLLFKLLRFVNSPVNGLSRKSRPSRTA
jgi:hypothetical protein